MRSIVSRMIWNDELAASLDPTEAMLLFRRMELHRVQRLSLALADRAHAMLEQNEWLLDSKTDDSRSHHSGHGDGKGGDARDGRRKGGRGRPRAQLQAPALGQKV